MRNKDKIKKVRDILNGVYPVFNFYNKDKIFDEILYIFFSWRTPINKAQYFYDQLKIDFPDFNNLFNLSESEWFKRMESGGKANDKARTLGKLLEKIKKDFGNAENVETLNKKSDKEAHKYLVTLPGIKDKSAYCIMLYTMKRAVFPADAHCLRVCQRLGIIDGSNQRKQDRVKGQHELNDLLKGDYKLCYDLHVTLLQHGQKICKKNPLCGQCSISQLCTYIKMKRENAINRN